VIKTYYQLTKPGIIYGNAITAAAGFFLASRGHFDFKLFVLMLLGLSLVIGSGCVFNNIFDKDIDAKMERTKNRALVAGKISGRSAIIYGICLGLAGFSILILFTNFLSAFFAFAGFFVYLALYTLLKRRSVYATHIGSVAGAMPPLVGYTAASGRFDAGAVILFFILALWQMPHFYAIAIRRVDEYKAAGIPVWPVKYGIRSTKLQMLFFIIAFAVAALMPTIFGYAGYAYFVVAVLLGAAWLTFCIKGFLGVVNDTRWARTMFLFSLAVILALCIMMAFDAMK